MEKLDSKPDETGYSVSENASALAFVELEGGPGRYRLDELDGCRIVTLQWSGSKERFKYVRDFLTKNVALNCPQFLMDLIIHQSSYKEYVCNVIPDSIRQSTPKGISWTISASFEVLPRDDENNNWPNENPFLVSAFDFETGFVDLVNTSRNVQIQGTAFIDNSLSINGTKSASLFSDGWFWLPVSADFGFGTGDFGIEFWYYYPDPPAGQAIDLYALNGVFNLFDNSAPQWQNQPLSGLVADFPLVFTPVNSWQHIFTGRKNGVAYAAVNGVMGIINLPSPATEYNVGTTGYIVFGNRTPDSSALFSGRCNIDRIRVYKGSCPYISDFVPSIANYPL